MQMSKCLDTNFGYVQALLSIVQYLELTKIEIIAAKDACHSAFSNSLQDKLKRKIQLMKGEDSFLHQTRFNSEAILAREISRVLYDVKFHGPNLVIVVANDDVVDLIFKMADKYDLLGFDTTWALIEFNVKMVLTKMPLKVINLSAKQARLGWNETQIVNVVNSIR